MLDNTADEVLTKELTEKQRAIWREIKKNADALSELADALSKSAGAMEAGEQEDATGPSVYAYICTDNGDDIRDLEGAIDDLEFIANSMFSDVDDDATRGWIAGELLNRESPLRAAVSVMYDTLWHNTKHV
jgi:hypothetical protein